MTNSAVCAGGYLVHVNKTQLTLGDLLDHPELGLRLVAGPDTAPSRTVRGAHSIEIPTPTRWVPQDWVMLTSGLRLRGRPEEQRRLVADLDAGGQAALGWAAGIVTKRVPKALVDEARRRAFPVFEVPLATAFHQIVSFLGRATAHDDVYVLHRVAAMEDHLLDALAAARPEQAVVRRLADVLDADVRLADADEVTHEPWAAYPVPGVPERTLVVGEPAPSRAPLAAPLVKRAVQLLELLARRDARAVAATRQQGAELLRRALRGDGGPTLDAEAAHWGWPSPPARTPSRGTAPATREPAWTPRASPTSGYAAATAPSRSSSHHMRS